MVERFFARITTEAIRRGSFSSVRQLQAAIDAYLAEHNKEPKPFTWTASANSIFQKAGKLPFLNLLLSQDTSRQSAILMSGLTHKRSFALAGLSGSV